MGTSWGFVDPDRDVAGAFLLNLLPADQTAADDAKARVTAALAADIERMAARA